MYLVRIITKEGETPELITIRNEEEACKLLRDALKKNPYYADYIKWEDVIDVEALPPGFHIERELKAWSAAVNDIKDVELKEAVIRIIEEYEPITPEVASKLGILFKTSSELWLRMESKFRKSLAKKALNSLKLE